MTERDAEPGTGTEADRRDPGETETDRRDPGATDAGRRDPGASEADGRDPGATEASRGSESDSLPARNATIDDGPTPPAATTDAHTSDDSEASPNPGEGRLRTSDLVERGDQDDEAASHDTREDDDADAPLLSDADSYLSRWQGIQAGFVDEPRRAVEDADSLVAEVMQRLAESFAAERDRLEQQWSGGEDAGTEELRQALRRYRSFFTRLLKT